MKFFLLAAFTLSASAVLGQVVTETVNFDTYTSANNNDLTNRFVFGGSATPSIINQIATGGITGGALAPPNDPSYMNDVVEYCSSYQNARGVNTTTAMCFKYNSSVVNPNSFARPIVISLKENPNGDYMIFNLNHDYRGSSPYSLGITTANYAQSTTIANTALITGHWYKLVAQYQPVGGTFNDQVTARLELFDIGTTGLSNPVSVAYHAAIIYRAPLVAAASLKVQIMGAKWGGAELLDNFSFSGVKGSSICTALATKTAKRLAMQLSPNPTTGQFVVGFDSGFTGKVYEVQLLDLTGRLLIVPQHWNNQKQQFSLDASGLSAGTYIVNMQTSAGHSCQKLIVE